jgi:tetratricopeptide (TPR) repeat protein
VGEYSEARRWNDKVYANREKVSLRLRILIDKTNANFYETPFEEIKYLRQFTEIDDQYPGTYYDIGLSYSEVYLYEEAIPEFEKALALYEKWEAKPWWIFNYSLLGEAYHKTGKFEKEKELYLKADRDFPNDPAIMYLRAVMMLSEGDTVNAASILERYKSTRRERSWTEAGIAYSLGLIHTEAGMLDKAEEYHRLELSLEPKNALRMYDLAWFLINNDRNIDEGMDLINKALETSPQYEWFLLGCKGWGLYKQGKYREALEVLERCRKITVYYRHDIILHIEKVKKALESDGKPAA